jgi:WD40 repeat protein
MKKLSLLILCSFSLSVSLYAMEKSIDEEKNAEIPTENKIDTPDQSRSWSKPTKYFFGTVTAVVLASVGYATYKTITTPATHACMDQNYLAFNAHLKEEQRTSFNGVLTTIKDPIQLFDSENAQATKLREDLTANKQDIAQAVTLLSIVDESKLGKNTKFTYLGFQEKILDLLKLQISKEDQDLITQLNGSNTTAKCERIFRIGSILAYDISIKKAFMAVTAHSDGTIRFWDLKNKNCSLLIIGTGKMARLMLSPSSNLCIAITEDNKVTIYETESGRMVSQWEDRRTTGLFRKQRAKIIGCIFTQEEKTVGLANENGAIEWRLVETGEITPSTSDNKFAKEETPSYPFTTTIPIEKLLSKDNYYMGAHQAMDRAELVVQIWKKA